MGLVIIIIACAIGLYMAWTIGANDFANALGSAVGSRSISVRWAIILGAVCELGGSVLVGVYVSDTLRKGIVVPEVFARMAHGTDTELAALMVLGMTSAMLGASVWLHVATWLAMPVSTSHAIVGAITGFGIAAAGWGVVDWGTMTRIGTSWVLSPVAGLAGGHLVFRLIQWRILRSDRPIAGAIACTPTLVFVTAAVVAASVLYKGHILDTMGVRSQWLQGNCGLLAAAGVGLIAALCSRAAIIRYLRDAHGLPLAEQIIRVESVFIPLVIVTACGVAFAHGANDVANAIGPLAAVNDMVRTGSIYGSGAIPVWMLTLGGLGIVLGLATYGHKVMQTVGAEITALTPSRGVAASLATTATVLVCCRLGWPVSTSHTIVGAVIGVGLARGLGAVNLSVTRQIVLTWLITVPAAALVTVLLFLAGRALQLDAVIARAIATGMP